MVKWQKPEKAINVKINTKLFRSTFTCSVLNDTSNKNDKINKTFKESDKLLLQSYKKTQFAVITNLKAHKSFEKGWKRKL